jgi:SAM-dependent methyltransferase
MHDDLITTTRDVKIDLTRGTQYDRLVKEEIKHYSAIDVTNDLLEGGIFTHDCWSFYFQYLGRTLFHTWFDKEVAAHANQIDRPRLLSLGCGYGGHELSIAAKLRKPFELIAVDLNPKLFREAEHRAQNTGLDIKFITTDLNFISVSPVSFDVIYAHASLHHILNLEHLFKQIHQGLKDNGRLIVLDIIGKTQVLFWKENVEFAAGIIKRMPLRYRPAVGKRLWRYLRFDPYSIIPKYAEPAVQVGMEGIRQEEIEPLILQRFIPLKLFKYNAFMRMICTNPYFGSRLHPEIRKDRKYLEKLINLDNQQIASGKLRPTEMFGVFKKTSDA